MNRLLDNLLRVLRAEIGFYQSLHQILQRQRKAIVNCEVKSLIKTSETKENMVLKFSKLEAQRMQIMAKLAAVLDVPQANLTLKKMVQLICEPYASELKDVRENLTDILHKVQRTNHENLALFKHSHRLVQSSLALLNKCILNSSVYQSSGKIHNARFNGTLLSGEI